MPIDDTETSSWKRKPGPRGFHRRQLRHSHIRGHRQTNTTTRPPPARAGQPPDLAQPSHCTPAPQPRLPPATLREEGLHHHFKEGGSAPAPVRRRAGHQHPSRSQKARRHCQLGCGSGQPPRPRTGKQHLGVRRMEKRRRGGGATMGGQATGGRWRRSVCDGEWRCVVVDK